jgi:hypothetical protein
MKLYRISQDENNHYDTFDSAVVCAADEEAARMTHPGTGWGRRFLSWCAEPSGVKVEYIGEAVPGLPVGVVCASFNAG